MFTATMLTAFSIVMMIMLMVIAMSVRIILKTVAGQCFCRCIRIARHTRIKLYSGFLKRDLGSHPNTAAYKRIYL